METNNVKFYVPSIEEFYVGFECEVMVITATSAKESKSSWQKVIFGDLTSPYGRLVIGQLLKTKSLDERLFRVKYLDKADVEELGWKFERIYINAKGEEIAIFHTLDKLYYLYCTFEDHFFAIDKEEKMSMFIGTIKNKSEAKKVMQWLNIKQE